MLRHFELEAELKSLEEWFKQNPKLPEEIDRLLLKRFFKCMHGDVEKTKKIIELNFDIRNKHPNIFIDRDPEDETTKISMDASELVPLPGLTPERYKLLFHRLIDYDPSKLNSVEDSKIFFMIADCRLTLSDVEPYDTAGKELEDDMASGDVQIVDIGGYTMGHIARVSLLTFRVYMRFLQEAYPVRLKAMHFINCPTFLDKMLTIFRPFINDEVYKMIHFHTQGVESLYDYVPRDMLPDEYGGKAGKMSDLRAKWTHILKEKRTYLMDPKQWKVEKAPSKSRWSLF